MNLAYLIGPITGLTAGEAQDWRTDPWFTTALRALGWKPLSPFDGLGFYPEQKYDKDAVLDSWFEDEHLGKNAAAKAVWKDLFFIDSAKVAIANLSGAERASIGSVSEITYCFSTQTPVITVLDKEGVHDHPFVCELSTFVVPTLEDAVDQLRLLTKQMKEPQYA
jgi:nucleoside 2-deoxyribosyltransferase